MTASFSLDVKGCMTTTLALGSDKTISDTFDRLDILVIGRGRLDLLSQATHYGHNTFGIIKIFLLPNVFIYIFFGKDCSCILS